MTAALFFTNSFAKHLKLFLSTQASKLLLSTQTSMLLLSTLIKAAVTFNTHIKTVDVNINSVTVNKTELTTETGSQGEVNIHTYNSPPPQLCTHEAVLSPVHTHTEYRGE